LAWVASTQRRFQAELARDAATAKDRAIVAEVSSGFKAGLAADRAREERAATEARAAAKAAKAARVEAAAAQAYAAAEKARRAAILVG
jgi:hypothetical protein